MRQLLLGIFIAFLVGSAVAHDRFPDMRAAPGTDWVTCTKTALDAGTCIGTPAEGYIVRVTDANAFEYNACDPGAIDGTEEVFCVYSNGAWQQVSVTGQNQLFGWPVDADESLDDSLGSTTVLVYASDEGAAAQHGGVWVQCNEATNHRCSPFNAYLVDGSLFFQVQPTTTGEGNIKIFDTAGTAKFSLNADTGGVWMTKILACTSANCDVAALAQTSTVWTNFGAAIDVQIDLDPAVQGNTIVVFVEATTKAITINPDGTDQILYATDAAGDAVKNTGTVGESIQLIAPRDGVWIAIKSGTWADVN